MLKLLEDEGAVSISFALTCFTLWHIYCDILYRIFVQTATVVFLKNSLFS